MGGKERPTNQAWLAMSCGSHLEHVGTASWYGEWVPY